MNKKIILMLLVIISFNSNSFSQDNEKNEEKKSSKSKKGGYRPFRIDLCTFSSLSIYTGEKGYGIGAILEPKYSIIPMLSLGLRGEAKVFLSSYLDEQISYKILSDNLSTNAFLNGGTGGFSYQLSATADFYPLPRIAVRPYIGIGVGFGNIGSVSGGYITVKKSSESSDSEKKAKLLLTELDPGQMFLLAPRVGIDLFHFRLNVVYNIFTGAKDTYNNIKVQETSTTSVSSLGTTTVTYNELKVKNPDYNNISFQIIFYLFGGRK